MFICPVWNPSNISRVFVKRHNFKLMITKMIQGYLISTLLHIYIPYIVRSLFTLRKCWSVQTIGVPCVSKSNMQRFCMNLRSPRKTATSPQTKDLSRGPPEQIGLSLTFLCNPKRMKKAGREEMIKITVLGLKYRVDQYREKKSEKSTSGVFE